MKAAIESRPSAVSLKVWLPETNAYITLKQAHPQAILGVYDFLFSNEHNWRNINKYPDASELYKSVTKWVWAEESVSIHIHPS